MASRILVVGAGAVGGYFGARLVQAGRDTTFLVRPARAQQIRDHGLQVISPHGNATLNPALVATGEIEGPYDLVLLSVKAFALEAAMADFAPAVGPGTTIMPVLNGMKHIDLLRQRFGQDAVIGGVCFVAAELDATARIVQMAPMQQLTYGEWSGRQTPRIAAVDAALQGAGFTTQLSADILAALWEKWVMLASLGALTCLLRGPVGEVAAAAGGTETALALVDECAAIAAANGNPPSAAFLERNRTALTAKGSNFTSSMYRDLMKGGAVEVEQILGDLLERRRGVQAPLLTAAAATLRMYQARALSPGGRTPPAG